MQRDGATAELLAAEPAPDALGEGQEHGFDRRGVERVAIEGVRVAHGFRGPALAHAFVDAMRALPDVTPVLAEPRLEHAHVHRGELGDRSESPALEDFARLRSDAPQPAELEWREERLLAARGDDDQPVRLAQVRPDLRAELVRGNPDGQHETELLAYIAFQLPRDVLRSAEQMLGRR